MRLHEWTARTAWLSTAFTAFVALAALAGAAALEAGIEVSTAHWWWVALGALVLMIFLVLRRGVWSAAGAYVAVFWCFHFGLVSVLAAELVDSTQLSLWDQAWVFGPFAADAAFVSLCGLAAFVWGASVVRSRRTVRDTESHAAGDQQGVHSFGTAGSLIVLLAIGVWCGVVIMASGLRGFVGAYGEYLQATADFSGPLSLVWLGLGCGIVLSVTGRTGWLRNTALAAFACFALVALPLGLRGEVMFPSIAALVAAARCGRVLSPGRACALVTAFLVLIPAIREVRSTGLQGLPEMVLDLRVFDAFTEMGGSLHPVEKVVRWRAEGEALDMGASYWAPIERAAARVLPGMQSSAADDDMRIMNVLVTDRVGAIGFSPVAEAYRNFGAFGVVLVLALLGAALSSIDRIAEPRMAVLVLAAVYVPLLVNVRNSFVSVPVQCALGLLFIAGVGIARHMSASINCRPYARAPYLRSQI